MINLITYAEVPLEVGLKALNIERLGTESAKKIAEDENAYNFIMLLINNDFPTDYSFEDIEKVVGPATTLTIIENKDKLQIKQVINNTITNTKSVSSIYEDIKTINGFKILSINKLDYVYYIDVELNMDINELKETLNKLLDYKVTSYDMNIVDCIVYGKIQIAYVA